MSVSLTGAEITAVGDIGARILEAPAPEDLDDWRADVLEDTAELIGAELGVFLMPTAERPTCVLNLADFAEDYPEEIRDLAGQYQIWDRGIELGVFIRAELYEPHLEEYYASPYYNEFVLPLGAFDAVAAVAPDFEADIPPQILLNSESPGRRFGAREKALFRLLYAPFASAMATHKHLGPALGALGTLVDGLNDAVVLFDRGGRLAHANPRARELLSHPRGPLLRAEIRDVAVAALEAGTDPPSAVRRRSRHVPMACWLEGVRLTSRTGLEGGALVLLRGRAAPPPPRQLLKSRFGLTPQQTRVAQYMAQRLTNREIADALCISIHTVYRHVEQVLLKLNVSSRRDVAARLSPPTDPS